MALSTVSFTTTFDYTNNVFIFTDTTDYSGQSVNTLVSNIPDVIGNFKITDPNGNVIWDNQDYSIESGTAQGGGGTSITLAAGASATDDYYKGLYAFLSAGTGSPQSKRVATTAGSYNGTTKVATTAAWVGTNPASGTTYKFTFGDIVPGGAVTNQTSIGLSLSVEGVPIEGTYTIVYTVKWDIAGTAQYATVTSSFDFEFVPPVIELGSAVDCLIPQLIASDETNYVVDGITPTITRTHTLYNPPSVGGSTTGTAADLSISSFYTPAVYEHTLSVILSYTLSNGTIVTMTLTGTQNISITCDHKLCDIYCCVRALWNNYQSYITTNPTLAVQYLNKLSQVTAIMTLINQAYSCSQGDTVDSYVSEILRIANCEPGCSCTDTTPIPVVGLGGSGTSSVVVSGNGTTVTSVTVGNTTTYTVNVSQSILNTITSLHNQVVTGTVSNLVTYNSGTYTYNVQGADLVVAADTQLPTTTSLTLTTTQSSGIDTQWSLKYSGRDYKLLLDYAPTSPATTATANEEIVGSTYSMVEDVVTTAQDAIRLKAIFAMVGSSVNSTLRMRIGGVAGTALFSVPLVYNVTVAASKYYSHNRALIVVQVTRISATSARVDYNVNYQIAYSYSGAAVAANREISDSYILTVPDFDNGTNVWCCTIDDASAGQTEVRNFSLELIPKV